MPRCGDQAIFVDNNNRQTTAIALPLALVIRSVVHVVCGTLSFLHTGSTPGKVTILSGYCTPRVRKLSVRTRARLRALECREALKHRRMDRNGRTLQEQQTRSTLLH